MNVISKKFEKIEEIKEQIRLEKEKMNTQLGRQLLAKLKIKHEDLSKENIDQLFETLVTLYQDHQKTVKHND